MKEFLDVVNMLLHIYMCMHAQARSLPLNSFAEPPLNVCFKDIGLFMK